MRLTHTGTRRRHLRPEIMEHVAIIGLALGLLVAGWLLHVAFGESLGSWRWER